MIPVEDCLVCGGRDLKRSSALVSPFLARRVWDRGPFPVGISRCRSCGFIFFNRRMDDEEERRLYAGYRSPEYQRVRFSCEPWYTEKFNANLNAPDVWHLRKSKLAEAVQQHFQNYKISSILDFGGDRGDLVLDLVPGAARYVYEISDVETLPGIVPLRSLDECKRVAGQHRFDLILSSNVVEHVAFPRKTLEQMNQVAAPGTLVYIEVPYESPFSFLTLSKRLVQNAILLGARPSIGLSLLRPGGLVQMHEHVNYFCPQALDRLVESVGWKIVANGVYVVGIYKIGQVKVPVGKMTWCMAQV